MPLDNGHPPIFWWWVAGNAKITHHHSGKKNPRDTVTRHITHLVLIAFAAVNVAFAATLQLLSPVVGSSSSVIILRIIGGPAN